MTVAKEGRTLDTGSIDLYDSFEGQIDKKGNIVSSLKIDIMFGTDAPTLIDLYGSIDSQFQGKWKWNSSWEVILEFKKKAKEHTLFDGRYSFTISRYNENDGSKKLGNGYIEINNGIMTVAKEGRTLGTGSIDLYDSFEGQIDKDGNITCRTFYIDIDKKDPTKILFNSMNSVMDLGRLGEFDEHGIMIECVIKEGDKCAEHYPITKQHINSTNTKEYTKCKGNNGRGYLKD